jgi:hypothetical protein
VIWKEGVSCHQKAERETITRAVEAVRVCYKIMKVSPLALTRTLREMVVRWWVAGIYHLALPPEVTREETLRNLLLLKYSVTSTHISLLSQTKDPMTSSPVVLQLRESVTQLPLKTVNIMMLIVLWLDELLTLFQVIK